MMTALLMRVQEVDDIVLKTAQSIRWAAEEPTVGYRTGASVGW